MTIHETSTAYFIPLGFITEVEKNNIKAKLSTVDFTTKDLVNVGYFESSGFIIIPKMAKRNLAYLLNKPLERIEFKTVPFKPRTLGGPYRIAMKPLPQQESIINNIVETFEKIKSGSDICKSLICLPPGGGKTFISSYVINQFKAKFVFIVHRAELLRQLYQSVSKNLNCNNFVLISSGAEFDHFANGQYANASGFFISHALIRTIIKACAEKKDDGSVSEKDGISYVISAFLRAGIDMKIVDEFDMEVKNSYMLDSFLNLRYNIYLTGTPYKSSDNDDSIFRLIYRNKEVLVQGLDIKLEKLKDMHYIPFKFQFNPRQFMQIKNAQSKRTAFKLAYNDMCAMKDSLVDYLFKKFYYGTTNGLNFKDITKRGQSVVFFVGRIKNADHMVDKLMSFGIPRHDIGIIHTDIKNPRKRIENMNKPYVVSLTLSLGRGIDNSKFNCLVFLEMSFSVSEFVQSISRVGRTGANTIGHVVYPCAQEWNFHMESFKSKSTEIARQFRNVYTYNGLQEIDYNKYTYGFSNETIQKNPDLGKYNKPKISEMKLSHLVK